MKTVIFAGGLGSRISEESHLRPKPMIEIGGKPILWHIMKIYKSYGFNDFIICLGYKGYLIKEYFSNYLLHNSDVTFDLPNNKMIVHETREENFKVTLVETGLNTLTAGRLKRIEQYLRDEENFMLTYGDGVADINITNLVDFHKNHGKLCTVTAVQPKAKFGVLTLGEGDKVTSFKEKPETDDSWINGGFFVVSTQIFKCLNNDMDNVMWEQAPMKSLQEDNELMAYKHTGFWKAMDILRDKVELEDLWAKNAPWKVW